MKKLILINKSNIQRFINEKRIGTTHKRNIYLCVVPICNFVFCYKTQINIFFKI